MVSYRDFVSGKYVVNTSRLFNHVSLGHLFGCHVVFMVAMISDHVFGNAFNL